MFERIFERRNKMKIRTFILYWLSGRTEEVTGKTIAEAFTNAGYGAGSLAALDYYEVKKDSKKGKTNEN